MNTSYCTDVEILWVKLRLLPLKSTNSYGLSGDIKTPGDLFTPIGSHASLLGLGLLERLVCEEAW